MSEVLLRASLKLPAMPNFLNLASIRHRTLDEAIGSGDLTVDVGDLDDEAVADFCNAWTVAFTAHAKARRAAREQKK